MSLQSPEIRAVLARVEKLEEANAQLKRVGGVVLLIAVATLLMGQTKQGATPWQKQVLRIGTVQANTIEVLPERISVVKGFSPVPAVRIRGSSLGSELTMFDENGKARVSLNGSMGLLQMGELETDSLGYVSPLQGNTVSLSASGNGGTLTLNDRSGEQTIHLSARPADAATGSEGGVILPLISDAPRLTLGKLDGYRTVIGSEELASCLVNRIGGGMVAFERLTNAGLRAGHERVAGDFFQADGVDDDFALGDAHGEHLADVRPRHGVKVEPMRDVALDVDMAIDHLGSVEVACRQREQMRLLDGMSLQR